MRPTRPSRLLPLTLTAIVLVSAACSSATPSSDVGSTAQPTSSSAASQAAVVSAVPSSSDAPASTAPSSAPSATLTPPPTPRPTPKPTPRPTPRPTTAATGYQCTQLLLNKEVRAATTLTDATLLHNANGSPQATGQTYCPYVAQGGQVTVAAAVWTGPSYAQFLALWDSVATYSQQATGIGSQAIIDAGDGVGLAIVGKVGVSIQIKGPSGVPPGVDAWTACNALLKLLAQRV